LGPRERSVWSVYHEWSKFKEQVCGPEEQAYTVSEFSVIKKKIQPVVFSTKLLTPLWRPITLGFIKEEGIKSHVMNKLADFWYVIDAFDFWYICDVSFRLLLCD